MESNPNRLGLFLISLSEDPALKEAFIKDPKASMIAQGLTEKEQQAVLTGNSRVLSGALATAAGIHLDPQMETESTTVVVVVVVIV